MPATRLSLVKTLSLFSIFVPSSSFLLSPLSSLSSLGLSLGLASLAPLAAQAHELPTEAFHLHKRQEGGGINGPQSSPQAAGYRCDPNSCRLPNCNCASVNPPGGLDPKDVPMFLVYTADDAIQKYTIDSVNQFLAQRRNPNGCPVKMSYYTSITYTNFSLVTDWYVAGNEIADHTMTHVGTPPREEVEGNLIALNALAGIPLRSIQGFRAPYLNYSVDTFRLLKTLGFSYDSSATSSVRANANDSDAFWPYTLDNGLANNCLAVPNICNGEPKIPGFWEIPMYASFDSAGGIHLMDPWLDNVGTANHPNDTATLEYLQSTFLEHYDNKRQPFGLYTHPIHLASGLPNVSPPNSTIRMINQFLDWAQQRQGVWIVSSAQLLAWVRNPVPLSRLNDFAPLKCPEPQVATTTKVCNGIPANEVGLLNSCSFPDFPWNTCYGCPEVQPSPANPNPPQVNASGAPLRTRVPGNCDTPFWDPIAGKCLCTNDNCKFTDEARPIGPNGANLTGGGTGGATDPAQSSNPYIPFSAAGGLKAGWLADAVRVWIGVGVAALVGGVGAGLVLF